MKKEKNIVTLIASTTWAFVVVFLSVCILEIWFNHSDFIPDKYQFDPIMLGLNLCLSIIVALQSSIIMIAQKQADELRDTTLAHSLDKRQVQYDEHQIKLEKKSLINLTLLSNI